MRKLMLSIFCLLLSGCGFIGGSGQTQTQEQQEVNELLTLPNLDFGDGCIIISRDNTITWEYYEESQQPCLEEGIIIDSESLQIRDDRPIVPAGPQNLIYIDRKVDKETEEVTIEQVDKTNCNFQPKEDGTLPRTEAEPSEGLLIGGLKYASFHETRIFRHRVPNEDSRNPAPTINDIDCLFRGGEQANNASKLWEWQPVQLMLDQERELINRLPLVSGPERTLSGHDTNQIHILSSWTGVGIEDLKQVYYLETLNVDTLEIVDTVDLRIDYPFWNFRFANGRLQATQADLDSENVEESWDNIALTASGRVVIQNNVTAKTPSVNDFSDIVTLVVAPDENTGEPRVYGYSPELPVEEQLPENAWWALGSSGAFFETGDEFWGVIEEKISQVEAPTGTQSEIIEIIPLRNSKAPKTPVTHAWNNENWIVYRTGGQMMMIRRGENQGIVIIDPVTGENLANPNSENPLPTPSTPDPEPPPPDEVTVENAP